VEAQFPSLGAVWLKLYTKMVSDLLYLLQRKQGFIICLIDNGVNLMPEQPATSPQYQQARNPCERGTPNRIEYTASCRSPS